MGIIIQGFLFGLGFCFGLLLFWFVLALIDIDVKKGKKERKQNEAESNC